jgi:hypothetical protein
VAGASVAVTTSATVKSILFNNANSNTATLTVNVGVVLSVTTGITNQNAASINTAATIQGAGALNCASISVGGTTTPGLTSSDFTATLTTTISNLSISGNLKISALYNSALSAANQGAFALGSGSVSVGGSVVFVTVPLFGPILTLASGSQNGTLNLLGSTPFTTIGGGTSTFALANSALVFTNVAAMPAVPISSFSLTNASLQFSLANSTTNVIVSTLTTGDPQNQINIASLPSIFSVPKQFTLLKYAGPINGAGFNFVLGNLPGGISAYLSNNLSQSSVDLVVITNHLSQTITFPSPGNQTYGVAPITLNAAASSGLIVSYAVTSGPATVAGNTLTITGAGSVVVQASQAGNDNWNAANPVTQTISIAPKSVTASIAASDKAYDATNTATITSRILTGVMNSDVVSLTGGTATFTDPYVGNGKTVTATGLTLSGADAGNYVLASTNATTTASITPATLTVSGLTAANKVYDGGTTATLNTGGAVLVGVIGSEHVNLAAGGAAGTFADKKVGTGKTIAVSGLKITGPDVANYTLIQPTASANITPKALTVASLTANNKLYDGTTTATLNSTSAALAGVLSGDLVALNTTNAVGTFADKNAANGKTVTMSRLTLSGSDAGNYMLAPLTSTANISPAILTVTANSTNRMYGAPNPAFTAKYSGFVNGEDASVLSGNALLTTSADTNSPVANYPIQTAQGTLSNANYSFSFVNGSLTITEGPATLSINVATGTNGLPIQIILHCAGLTPNSTYHINATPDLGQWTEIGAPQADNNGTITFTDFNIAAVPVRFYRLAGN